VDRVSEAAKRRLLSQLDAAQVAPNLWIGAAPPQGDLLGEIGFDALVLCANNWQPASSQYPGVEVHHAPFRDAPDVTKKELKTALRAAEWAAERLTQGKTVLVTCMAGLNRSGLVTALSLSMAAGFDPATCGELVRSARGPDALHNPSFVDALNRARPNPCELCKNERLTPRFHEDHVCWVAFCKTCKCPMVVLRRHSMQPTKAEKAHMTQLLFRAFGAWRPGWACKVDERQRTIPDHFHMHARPA
jgi:protein-tyrosine phosphatase